MMTSFINNGQMITEPDTPVILNPQSSLNPSNDSSIGSFAWMLAQPYSYIAPYTTKVDDNLSLVFEQTFPVVNDNNFWAFIPLCLATYANRKNTMALLLAKTTQPHKIIVESVTVSSLGTSDRADAGVAQDRAAWRNPMAEYDVTVNRCIKTDVQSLNCMHAKHCSLWPPVEQANVYDIVPNWKTVYDGGINVYSVQPVQAGSIYPRTYNIIPFNCMLGTTVYTPCSPSLTYSSRDNDSESDLTNVDILERAIIGAPISHNLP